MSKLYSKWFDIDEKKKRFTSKREAETIDEAWDKTIEKWILIVAGFNFENPITTCGLCEIFLKVFCTGCPIEKYTGKVFCYDSPLKPRYFQMTQEDKEHELMFLLMLREMGEV